LSCSFAKLLSQCLHVTTLSTLRFYTDWFDPTYSCITSEAKYEKCKNENNNVKVSVYKDGVEVEGWNGLMTMTYGKSQEDQVRIDLNPLQIFLSAKLLSRVNINFAMKMNVNIS